jgi:hypothetical protein
MARQGSKAGTGARPAPEKAAPPARPKGPDIRTAEEEVLQILGGVSSVWEGVDISDALFADTRCRAVFRHWRDQWKAHRSVDPAAAVEALGAADGPWLTALLLEGKKFDDPREDLARSVKSLELSVQRRERTALEREVLDMLEGRRTRDEVKILRYQTLTRLLRAATPGGAGSSDR